MIWRMFSNILFLHRLYLWVFIFVSEKEISEKALELFLNLYMYALIKIRNEAATQYNTFETLKHFYTYIFLQQKNSPNKRDPVSSSLSLSPVSMHKYNSRPHFYLPIADPNDSAY